MQMLVTGNTARREVMTPVMTAELTVNQNTPKSLQSQSSSSKGNVRQEKQQNIIPRFNLDAIKSELAEKQLKEQRLIDTAWRFYNLGSYEEAVKMFAGLFADSKSRQEAMFGAALCHIKLNAAAKAIPILEKLVHEKYKLRDTFPSLIALLVDNKLSVERSDTERLVSLVAGHKQLLSTCAAGEEFLNAADAFREEERALAAEIYRGILAACAEAWDVRVRTLVSLKEVTSDSEIMAGIGNELDNAKLPPAFRREVENLKTRVLVARLVKLPADSPEAHALAEEIMKMSPDDKTAQSVLAWADFNGGRYKNSLDRFERLLKRDPAESDFTYGLVLSLMKLKMFDEALAQIQQYKGNSRIAALETEARILPLKDRLASAVPGSPEAYAVAEEILKISPDDRSAQATLAWADFNGGRYKNSLDRFERLLKRDPAEGDYAYGLVLSLIKLKMYDEALIQIEKHRSNSTVAALETELYRSMGLSAYEEGNYALAERYLEKISAHRPRDTAARELLAWSKYKQGKREEAFPIFLELFKAEPKPSYATVILDGYERTGRKADAIMFAEEIAKLDGGELHRIAADYFYACGWPVKASRTYAGSGTCYYHADASQLDAGMSLRYKTGDSGLSRLNEFNIPLRYSISTSLLSRVSVSYTYKHLSAGSPPKDVYAGSFYNGTQVNPLITTMNTGVPELTLIQEGAPSYKVTVGTTPLDGPVGIAPTFDIKVQNKNMAVTVYRKSVDESILSYAGLKDPYGDGSWGRVLKTGLKGELQVPQFSPWWLTVSGGYEAYSGRNTWENESVTGNIAAGRTFIFEKVEFNPGLYADGKHFDHNSNFYTFGHGGYFSPQKYFAVGPMAGIRTRECGSFSAEMNLAASYYISDQKSSPVYPLQSWRTEMYKADNTSGIGYSMKLAITKQLIANIKLDGKFELNQAPNWRETVIGLWARASF